MLMFARKPATFFIDRRSEQILARLTAAGLRREEYPPDFPHRLTRSR